MSNYNQLRLTYHGGEQTAITLSSNIIQANEYQGLDIAAVEVPEIVTEIGEYAFCDNSLTSITLNEGLEMIHNQAFQHGTYSTITIPSTVTYIGANAFNIANEQGGGLAGNLTITCLATVPPMLVDNEGITFGDPSKITAIYVPSGSVSSYKSDWPQYASKISDGGEPETGFTNLTMSAAYVGLESAQKIYLGPDVIWQASSPAGVGDVVYIDNSGITHTDNYSGGVIPDDAYRGRDDIVSVSIGPGIFRIGNTDRSYVFAGCDNLSAVTIGPDVEYIGGRAFEATPYLKNVTIPASVTIIDTNAFYNFNSSCTITFEGDMPSMTMQEQQDLGYGTNIMVPDEYFSNYCSFLGNYNLNVESDQGNTCGSGPGPVDSMFWEPLTIEIENPGTAATTGLMWRLSGVSRAAEVSQYGRSIVYSRNDGPLTLVQMTGTPTTSKTVDVVIATGLTQGEVFKFYGASSIVGGYGFVSGTTEAPYHYFVNYQGLTAKVYGNIKSLLTDPSAWNAMVQRQNKEAIDDIPMDDRAFMNLFRGKTGFTFNEDTESVEYHQRHLVLPDRNLSTRCFADMFNGCTRMRVAPELPATELAEMCYYHLFSGCSALAIPPELPATTLAPGCYRSMFQYCTNLAYAPVLPAPVVATSAYSYMFGYCRNLTGVTCLAEDISADNSTYNWLTSVYRSGTFTKAPSMTGWTRDVSGIPTGWTVQDYVEPNQ